MKVQKEENFVRVIVIDISKVYGSKIMDEAILPTSNINDFTKEYFDMKKYRIITI